MLYRRAAGSLLAESGTTIQIGEATELVVAHGRVAGLVVDGGQVAARTVVIATGTFLDGALFCGMERRAGGRTGEKASVALAAQLRELGVAQARLKTGTPPRLDGRTIDWARLTPPGRLDDVGPAVGRDWPAAGPGLCHRPDQRADP
jgi:tRNA uridine 5-carboxymethylaminomethyl modification enzyme